MLRADVVKLKVDAKASKVEVSVAEPMRARGDAVATFTITSGEVSGDPSNTTSAGNVTIILDAASYDSGNPMRDDAVTGRYLNTSDYPSITFKGSSIKNVTTTSSTSGSATIVGDLTIHGTTRPMEVPFQATFDPKTHQLSADGTLTFKYTDFGVKTPSLLGGTLSAGDDATVKFHVVATQASGG